MFKRLQLRLQLCPVSPRHPVMKAVMWSEFPSCHRSECVTHCYLVFTALMSQTRVSVWDLQTPPSKRRSGSCCAIDFSVQRLTMRLLYLHLDEHTHTQSWVFSVCHVTPSPGCRSRRTSIASPSWRRHRSAPAGTWRAVGPWDAPDPLPTPERQKKHSPTAE